MHQGQEIKLNQFPPLFDIKLKKITLKLSIYFLYQNFQWKSIRKTPRKNQESMEKFRDLFVMTAQALVTHNSQKDVTVAELKNKLSDKSNFFAKIIGIFRRKK